MKKRRELDALVGGVKSRRKNSNSGHELLKYNGSDSSDDDYQLTSTKIRGSGLCSTCTSVFMFLLLVACMLVCAGLTWMHVEMKKDLEILRISLQTVEGRSMASTDDVEKLYKQMATVNKTLDQQTKTINSVISDISAINKSVTQLSDRVNKLGEGLKSAPELKQLPEKLQTVSQTVATMGSDVKNMKDTVDKVSPYMKTTSESLDSFKQQLEGLTDQVNANEATPDRESLKPEMANVIQGLSNQLQIINSTVSTQMSLLLKSGSQQEERLVKLEDTSKQLMKNLSSISSDHTSITDEHQSITDDYSSEKFKSSVTDIVQNLMNGEGLPPSNSNVDNSNVEAVMANVSTILNSLNDLEEKYKTLEAQEGSVTDADTEYVTMEMFKTLGDGFEAKVDILNSSFVNLKADVKTMSQMLTRQSNTVTNLTHQVDATKLYITTLIQKISDEGVTPVVLEGQGTEKVTKSTTEKPEELVTTKKDGNQPIEDETTTSKGTTPGPTQTKRGAVSVPAIKTLDDLELFFHRWDRGGTGQVKYDVLPDYLGPYTPKEDDLKPFDEDHNGLYSLPEFAKAFGFSLATTTTTTESDTEVTQPPR